MKYSAGPLAHEKMMRSIQLNGEKVIPLVRDMTRQNAPRGALICTKAGSSCASLHLCNGGLISRD